MNSDCCMILTTTPNKELSNTIIKALFEDHLAACVQTMPIESHYLWEGELCKSEEVLLVIKTQLDVYSAIEELIVRLHDYDVPQVVQVPFSQGLNPYLEWINSNVGN
ncbi:divalent-cation tolerance protein CutA [Vibrio amylolyticus]|uniref:divalent-cation tolerance protein CutA n=1 Tax=Vibrio TaxID=662 RepID=UPI000C83A7DB|nr:divalent-cation tolerance protein CutA [Vibrio sp. 10N.261.55.A7]PMJ89610.1 cytochrome C biogenesis protein [Vibrio sp. 10N.261.55.A7]